MNDKNLLFKTSLKIHAMTMKCQDFSIRMEGISEKFRRGS